MKQLFFLIAVIGFTQVSCKKTGSGDFVLDGKWRMIIVKDNASGSTTTKPASIQGDVDISFTSTSTTNGTFTGNTPTNEIDQNDFSIGINQSLTIPNLSMTKVAETSWGSEFVDHIRSSLDYSIDVDDKLIIRTVNRTLTFRKL